MLSGLRHAIACKLETYNQIVADPKIEIKVGAGSTGLFCCAYLALRDPGDKILLFRPYYGHHVNILLADDGVPAYVPMTLPDLAFGPDDLERVVLPMIKGIMVCFPLRTPDNGNKDWSD